MSQILRVTINWTGFIGAPGYTNLHFRDFAAGDQTQAIADGAVAKTDFWIQSLQMRVPPTVTLQVDPTVEVIEDTTGDLVGFFNAGQTEPRVGTGTGAYSAASGACVNWYTGGIRNGRRVRGRSFIVPLAGSALGTDGSIDETQLAGLRTATTALLDAAGSGDLGVWSRPSSPLVADGAWYAVTAFTIPDRAAVLRSRRN